MIDIMEENIINQLDLEDLEDLKLKLESSCQYAKVEFDRLIKVVFDQGGDASEELVSDLSIEKEVLDASKEKLQLVEDRILEIKEIEQSYDLEF